jgi:hypothetical protein
MRRRLLLVFATLLLIAPGWVGAQPVTGGVKAGVVFADLTNFEAALEDAMSTSMRTGFIGGGFVTFGEPFAVQAEVLYTQKGTKAEELGVDVEVDIDQIEIPVLARYTFGTGATRGYVFGGPSFDFKVDAKLKASFEGEDEEEDIDEDVETFEFAIVVGGGVEFGHFLVEARYSMGLTDLVKDNEDFDESIRNRTFAILGGVRF